MLEVVAAEVGEEEAAVKSLLEVEVEVAVKKLHSQTE
jgi:hypothetical protein